MATAQELKAILDTIAPGTNVVIAYQSAGKNLSIEGVVKQK